MTWAQQFPGSARVGVFHDYALEPQRFARAA